MHHPTDRIAHTTTIVPPVVEDWLELEIAQKVTLRDRSDDPSNHEWIQPQRYNSPLVYLDPYQSKLAYKNCFKM